MPIVNPSHPFYEEMPHRRAYLEDQDTVNMLENMLDCRVGSMLTSKQAIGRDDILPNKNSKAGTLRKYLD